MQYSKLAPLFLLDIAVPEEGDVAQEMAHLTNDLTEPLYCRRHSEDP